MILKSKKNTSFKLPPKKTRKPRTKKGEKNANLLPEAESLLDKLNRKTLVDRLNATNFNVLYDENSEIINYLIHFFLLHFIF